MVTALLGGYEQQLMQPVAATSKIPFLCLTDDDSAQTQGEFTGWQNVRVEPRFPLDQVRSARYLKIVVAPELDDYDEVLWIDNRVVLKVNPEEIFESLGPEYDLGVGFHSSQATLVDEFRAVLMSGYDDPGRVRAQYACYLNSSEGQLREQPLWTGMMIRRRSDRMVRFSRDWMEQVLLYSRRDQLSVLAAIKRADLRVKRLELNNIESDWHTWVPVDRIRRDKRTMNWRVKSGSATTMQSFVDAVRARPLGRLGLSALQRAGVDTTLINEDRL